MLNRFFNNKKKLKEKVKRMTMIYNKMIVFLEVKIHNTVSITILLFLTLIFHIDNKIFTCFLNQKVFQQNLNQLVININNILYILLKIAQSKSWYLTPIIMKNLAKFIKMKTANTGKIF